MMSPSQGACVAWLSEQDEEVVARLAVEVRTVRLRDPSLTQVLANLNDALAQTLRSSRNESAARRRERVIRRRLEPVLEERQAFDRLLEGAPLVRAALETVLGALGRPAMVVNEHGELLFANELARSQWSDRAEELERTVRACANGTSHAFELTPLAVGGKTRHWFAVEPVRERDPRPLLESAQARWSLTARECETLAHLAEGLSNRAIAAHLECAERTVEVHVARLLSKSKSGSRSEVIARFWSDDQLDEE